MSDPRHAQRLRWLLLASLVLAGCDQLALVAIIDAGASAPSVDGPGRREDAGMDAGAPPDMISVAIDECGADNPAALSEGYVAALRAGGPADPAQRLLYPYDGTVFPGGMTPPLVMWDGKEGEAVLLRLRTKTFEYEGCLLPSAPGQVAIPDRAWTAAEAASGGAQDPVELQLTTLASGRASGPLSRTLVIAGASLPGAVHYMSYGFTGVPSIWRLRPKQPAESVFAGANVNCSGCHALAANGTRMVGFFAGSGTSFRVSTDPTIEPEPIQGLIAGGDFGALSPDGSLFLAPHSVPGIGPRSMTALRPQAGLFEVDSGTELPGANIPEAATVPAFSPGGTLLAFNDSAVAEGHSLVVMDFDPSARTASNYRELFRDATSYPAWPGFVPGDRAIVFARGETADFSASGAMLAGGFTPGPKSDLYSIELTGGEPVLLARAMGLPAADAGDADSYLPFAAEDLHQNYYPSMAPVIAGGYAWVFFDSIRHYGNQGLMRQIWGAAIDLSGNGDGSHPAFYLPGQDTSAVNLRAVVALDPCLAADSSCVVVGE